MYIKQFDSWGKIKKIINTKTQTAVFRPGDIYWCKVGVNVASEIDGKGSMFNRPVLVIGVFKQNLLFVIPLTSGHKEGSWHFHLKVEDREASACLHQAKTISKDRMEKRIERLGATKLNEIKKAFAKFYSL